MKPELIKMRSETGPHIEVVPGHFSAKVQWGFPCIFKQIPQRTLLSSCVCGELRHQRIICKSYIILADYKVGHFATDAKK